MRKEPIGFTSNEQILYSFELNTLWERYNSLRQRDYDNHSRLIRLFTLLIIYASAPFTLQTFTTVDFIRVWGLGGMWLALSVWFAADRDFRTYGVHIKERVYCLLNLAVLRKVLSEEAPLYRKETLLPIGQFRNNPYPSRSTFPERISSAQMAVASYFFKFTSLFPFLYLFIFIGFLIIPHEMLSPGDQRTILAFLRIVLACSFLLFAWVWSSAHRCLELQKIVFTARRICHEHPWPVFPADEIKLRLSRARNVLFMMLLIFSLLIAIINIYRGLELLKEGAAQIWTDEDKGLLMLTLIALISLFSFFEADIRSYMKVAQLVFPVPTNKEKVPLQK